MSNLTNHARLEMQLAGLFDADSDYGGMIGEAVMELVEKFAAQGHSGFSAGLALAVFDKVARFQPLTPLTTDPAEWMEVATGMWQNRRNPAAFSTDGGKTWYDVDDPERTVHESAERRAAQGGGHMTLAEMKALTEAVGGVIELRTRLDRAEAERDALKVENERLWAALHAIGAAQGEPEKEGGAT